MQKIALISKSQTSDWVSCISISANLLRSYTSEAPRTTADFKNFHLNEQDSAHQARNVALHLREWGAQKVIFLDHSPSPTRLIQALTEISPTYRPDLIIHVYGDFPLNSQAWIQVESVLQQFSVKFICASDKQSALLRKFVVSIENQIQIMPFPVADSEFYFSSAARSSLRDERGIVSTDSVFIYSGRLSLQKNILSLIRAFDFYNRHIQTESWLWLAGPVDDLGIPYLGKRSPLGLMAYDLQILIRDLFQGERAQRIRYLGNLSAETLNKNLSAADVFISLSTHNDEDYGMAPAEALLTGCHGLLSDWGGYSSFKRMLPDQCTLVPVKMDSRTIAPEQNEILKGMMAAPLFTENQRQAHAQQATQYLGIKAGEICAQKLILEKNQPLFSGFTPLFRRLSQSFALNPEAPLSRGQEYSDLYREIYDVYCN